MQSKSSKCATISFVLLCLTVLGQARAAWFGEEGELWLNWKMETRSAYVYAYTAGIRRGFTAGCSAGIDYLSSKRQQRAEEAEGFLAGCSSRSPVAIAKIDEASLVKAITAFFQAYPKQRFLNISDVLLKLLAGHTVDQIHAEFPQNGGGRRE